MKTYFPTTINRFVEPFVGGGSVFLNIKANEYLLNDIDNYVIEIHKFLSSYIGKEEEFYHLIFSIIEKYNLSFSYKKNSVPPELKQQHKKTYFAHFNRQKFNRLKSNFNSSGGRNMAELYVLLIYGFNRILRFNRKNEYNLPVGNVDFNANVFNALSGYFNLNRTKKTNWYCLDFKHFLESIEYQENDFIYLDPPYLITCSEYNKLWNETKEKDLLQMLDNLNERKVKFAISNVTHYKGKENSRFIDWTKKYVSYQIKSNYISYHDNTIKKFDEILVTNFDHLKKVKST